MTKAIEVKMNIYRVTEDGVAICIKAKTMQEAIGICEDFYVAECVEAAANKYMGDDCKQVGKLSSEEMKVERAYYHEQLLAGCELLGELRN